MPRKYTREDYMTHKTVQHHEYYLDVAHAAGLGPHTFSKGLQTAILASTDPHFNDIPLSTWDELGARLSPQPKEDRGNGKLYSSKATTVCALKAVAEAMRRAHTAPTPSPTGYPILAHEHAINGVPGCLGTIYAPQNGVHRNQSWTSEARAISGYGPGGAMRVYVRFDDNCGNGHQSFAITADVWTTASRRRGDVQACGCLHGEIAQVFPELAPLIKWHLVSTTGPMHYVENTCYHASDRDHHGCLKGEPYAWDLCLRFGDFPMRVKVKGSFIKWLEPRLPTLDEWVPLIVAVEPENEPHGYQYSPKYSLDDFTNEWHECPFDTHTEAQEFVLALKLAGPVTVERTPILFGEGKERNFDAARSVAVWPDATDEQLSLPRPELETLLKAQLPALLDQFRADVTAAGFLYE